MLVKNSFQTFSIQKAPFLRSKYITRTAAVLLAVIVVTGIMKPASAAIAYKSASSGNNGGGSTSLIIDSPVGATVGDVLVFSGDVRSTGSVSLIPSGDWVLVNEVNNGTITKSTYYTVLTSTPPVSYIFDINNGLGPFTAKASGGIIAYSGVDTISPIHTQAIQSYASSTTSTAPSITTTVPNAMIVALYGTATGTTSTQGSSMTERYDNASTSNGVTSRTTSAGQDAIQAAAGASGTKTMTMASGAAHIGHTIALTPAPVVSQVGYRWFANTTTAGTVGSPLAAQDTAATAPAAGQPFRLRMLLGVAEKQLPTTTAFKLQYKLQATGSCVSTGTFNDITTGTPIKYYDNAGVSDAASIVTNGSDPVRSGVTKVTQTYEELNNFTVATAIPVNQDGMWDFALTLDTSASSEGTYCLRAVNANGSPLPTYSQIPSISALAPASKVVQGSYRLSQNANSLTPGSPLAATNTSTTLGATNDSFRLRATAKGYQGFIQVSSGESHTCGIASDNLAYCWGDDSSGQLGNGATTGTQTSPVAVVTSGVLSGKTILSISAGNTHTCAIASDNLAYCWGNDSFGQLGNGATTGTQTSPVAVVTSGVLSGKTILSISVGNNHTCAIASDSLAYCWGRDTSGELGDDSTLASQTSPVAVEKFGVLSGKTISSITTGSSHTCAIASDNLAYCWGGGSNGQLGNGAFTASQPTPTAVSISGSLFGKTVLKISAGSGSEHTCAIASDNNAYCWGLDSSGQLGDGGFGSTQNIPVAVDTTGEFSGLTVLNISVGSSHTCAIASDNRAYCWGSDSSGQLGNSTRTGDKYSPELIALGSRPISSTALSISSGNIHTCIIASDNQAYCWGNDTSGQIGNDTTSGNQISPVIVNIKGAIFGKTILSISTGAYHTCAVASDNQAYCWGDDFTGALGNGAITGNQALPVAVDTSGVLSGKTILSVSAGSDHTCAIASDNQAYCWGDDSSGQLGNGATTGAQASPVAVDTSGVLSGKTILSITAGEFFTCAIASDNQAYCWGNDSSGQLGNGATTGNQVSPVSVNTSGILSGKTILSISTGMYHACVVASDNQAYCWGDDSSEKLGNGATTGTQVSPVAVDNTGALSGKTVSSISAAENHTCVIASDNQAYCWGFEADGRLGNGTSAVTNEASPVAVTTSGALSGKTILSITAGIYHTCAIASDNRAYCWGDDTDGEVGDDTNLLDMSTPVAVYTGGILAGKNIAKIDAGTSHVCAVTSEGIGSCWGSDLTGQLGNDGAFINQPLPVGVSQYLIGGAQLLANRLSLTLQFAQKTLGSCSVQTGFASITSSTPIAFNDNAGVASTAAIAPTSSDPITNGGNTLQTYHDLVDTISNPTVITGESSGLWDFSLRDNGAPASTTYCLRLASSDGTAFGYYENYPEFTTASGGAFTDPQGGLLRGGQSVVNGIKNLFSW